LTALERAHGLLEAASDLFDRKLTVMGCVKLQKDVFKLFKVLKFVCEIYNKSHNSGLEN
jgi:hypothetical protein